MKKILIIAGFVAVLAVFVGMSVHRAREKGVEVELHAVDRRDLVARVSGSGRIEASRSVSITSRVVGKVLELAAAEGDAVAKGDLILRIDPGERGAQLLQAKATLARAKATAELAAAELRQAEFELNRTKNLKRNDLASEQALEAAQTGYEVKIANVAAAREDVRNAEAGLAYSEYELDKTIIRAEISGVIVRLSVEEGENVLAGDLYNAGSPIVVIADLSAMEAHILVDETEVVEVRKGQKAEVTVDAFPNRELTGRVVEVGSSAYNAGPLGSQEAKDFRIKILLDEAPPSLRPGLSARAEVVTDRREGALAVPIEGLTIRDPKKEERALAGERTRRARGSESGEAGESREVEGVFVEREGRAVFTPLETGIAGDKYFEVLGGLTEGDRVVRGPFDAIRTLESGERLKEKKKKRGRTGRGDRAGSEEEGA